MEKKLPKTLSHQAPSFDYRNLQFEETIHFFLDGWLDFTPEQYKEIIEGLRQACRETSEKEKWREYSFLDKDKQKHIFIDARLTLLYTALNVLYMRAPKELIITNGPGNFPQGLK